MLALDAPAVAREIAIGADDAVARNGECDRISGAGASDRAGRGRVADPTGEFHVGHRPSDTDRAKLLPDAALKRRPAHIEHELKSLGGPVHEAYHLRQIIMDDGLVRKERGLGKAGGEVRLQLVMVDAEKDGADAFDDTGDQHLAQGALA